MERDQPASSFDALAYEHNLSTRLRDLCRTFFLAGLKKGREQNAALEALERQQPRRQDARGDRQ